MENSETHGKAWILGEALVRELSDESRELDTLSRWMAHYVAEQMTLASQSSGKEHEGATERCFQTILTLWNNRTSYPFERRPLESFDPIFRMLDRLAPENRARSFYMDIQASPKNLVGGNDASEEKEPELSGVEQWLEIASNVDRCARVIIDVAVKAAALEATDEKTREWLEKASSFGGDDIMLIFRLMDFRTGVESGVKQQQIIEEKRRNLESKLSDLAALTAAQNIIHMRLMSELESLNQPLARAKAVKTNGVK